jgi:multidrug resistance efflux pump
MRIVLSIFAVAIVALAASPATPAEPIVKKDATVNFIEDARVPAEEEGILTEVLAKDGQEVAKGQVLAKIDQKLVELQRDVAQAEFVVAQRRSQDYISIDYANKAAAVFRADYERKLNINVKMSGVISKAEIEQARLQWEQYILQAQKSEFERGIAELDMKVSEAKRKAAQEHIERSNIVARWNGVIDRVARFTGDWVKPGDPILRMYRMDRVRVTCNIDAFKYTPQDVDGQGVTVTVTLPGNVVETFQSRVERCSSSVDLNDTFQVWTELDNRRAGGRPDGYWILRPNMIVTMTIQTK